MASYTPNYNLKKPADADTYDIADANGNMDLIDTALHSQNQAINSMISSKWIDASPASISKALNVGKNQRAVIDGITNSVNSSFSIILITNSSGSVTVLEKAKGASVSFDTSVAEKLTINYTDSRSSYFLIQAGEKSLLDRISLAT